VKQQWSVPESLQRAVALSVSGCESLVLIFFRLLGWTVFGAAILIVGECVARAETEPVADGETPQRVIDQFVGNYCLECHDSVIQKAERDLEPFRLPLNDLADLITAQEIIDQVTLREMPPKKAAQPSDEERLKVVRALRQSIAAAKGNFESNDGRTVMRRLSNREYENTLAALFGRRVDTLGLTADFPKENASRHLDTIGESLVTSGFLLDQYFQAAHRLVELRLGKPEMKPKDWHFTKNFRQYEELSGAHKSVFNYESLALYEQPNTTTRQGGYGHIEDFLEGVPISGLYDIKVHAQAKHRDTHYDPKIFRIDLSEPFILGVVPGDVTKGHIHYPQAIEPVLAQSVVPDEKPEWLDFRVWLEAGQTPRFIFPNGPYESRASVIQINQRYKKEFKGKVGIGVSRTHILRQGALPHILISDVEIHGPIAEEGGSKEERAVFGDGGFKEEKAIERLNAFAVRAFRRHLTDEDRGRIRSTYGKRLKEKAAPRQAALDTLKMILCSPSFLYLSEITEESARSLGSFDLATRLSYALWAAPPDGELRGFASKGALLNSAELRKQAERMLNDKRVSGFVEGFLGSWLNLRELGQMPPPRESAAVFYAEDLPTSMKQEAHLFFQHLLKENRPASDFLTADYTFVDKKLATLYGLPEKDKLRLADGFQRVSLKDNRHRGGLLGMAGVLTVSANGVETSPVTRGVWLLENVLGITPPPPPDEVPEIEPDVRGATTIRERLKKHSTDKACAECHRKIDPLGFALETFDPIGRFRSHYPKPKSDAPAAKIDSSGIFPSGESYADVHELKKVLVGNRKDLFTRHLINQFLSYSTGRHMEAVDRIEIDEILDRVRAEGYGLRTLILESLDSEIFRSR
jgi:hypothetical protein